MGSALGGAIAAIVAAVALALAVVRCQQWRKEINNMDWLASWTEIYIHQSSHSVRSLQSGNHSHQAAADGEHPQSMFVQGGVLQAVQKKMRSAVSLQKSRGESRTTTNGSKPTNNSNLMRTSTIVATFRGNLVMVRPCAVDHVELSSHVRSEVRLVRGLVSENLLKFVAACIEPEHVVVLEELCSRGTLEV